MTARRRAKGEGSVYRQRAGLWAGSTTLLNGKRKYVYAPTQGEAVNKLKKLRHNLDRGIDTGGGTQTVREYFEWWLADMKQSDRVSPKTYAGYESKTRLHVLPMLGKIRLAKLTPIHIRQLLTEKSASGLSPRSVQYVHATIHVALETARKLELIDRNVSSLVDPPKLHRTERRAYTVEQAQLLLDTLRGDRLEAFYRLLLTTGLRSGEAYGLRWSAIDFEARTLRVGATLFRYEGRWVLKEYPKSDASRQTLPLPASCLDSLKRHRVQQAAERLHAGELWNDEFGLVFTRENGEPLWFGSVVKKMRAYCRLVGLPELTLHELRHTTPSMLLALGVDQRVIMQILRHSTITLTADLYTHVADKVVRTALDGLDSALRPHAVQQAVLATVSDIAGKAN